MEYLEKVRQAIHSHRGSINFVDSANIRQIHGILMNDVRDETTFIRNKYKIQIDPLQFDWDKFLPPLEKDFPGILKEVLSCKINQQQPISNVYNSIQYKIEVNIIQ